MTGTVVIATYRRPKEVRNLLAQLHTWNPEVPVLVVDQEKTALLTQSEIKRWSVTVLQQTHANLPQARNRGWRQASSDVVIFLDDDVELQPSAISAHLDAYTANTAGIAGRVINARDIIPTDTDVVTGRAGQFFLKFTWNFWSTRPQEVQFPYGCNMSFRREVLKKIGGFDELFVPPLSAFEEVDCGLRAGAHGVIHFEPTAVVTHLQSEVGGTRLSSDRKAQSYWYCYGRLLKKQLSVFLLPFVVARALPRAFREGSTTVSPFFRGIVS